MAANKPINTLSYSKITTFKTCSWLAWAHYHLFLPREHNEGSAIGDAAHRIVECLAAPKREKLTNSILTTKKWPVSILRLGKIVLKKNGFYSKENLKKTLVFVSRFVRYDFHFAGSSYILPAEQKFKLKENSYILTGFIDRAAIFEKNGEKYIVIRDAKTQKENFTNEELEFSIQGLSYLLAAKKMFPDINIEKSWVEFVMLAHPDNFVRKVTGVDDEALEGFEYMLGEWQKTVDQFNEQKATQDMAASKGWPKKGEPFGGLAKCGYGKFPGHIKPSTGEPYYVCSAKWPFDYYVLKDSSGKVLTSKMEKPDDGQNWELVSYEGCPAWNK